VPLEIELKLKLDSHAPVHARLAALHAEHRGTVRETNIFFDRPDRSLRRADSGLRVRLTSTPAGPTPQALLTFKGPAASSGLRSREAFDLHLTPPDQIVPLLQALGFVQLFLFEKDRDSWRLADCLVELDTLPHFGNFLEIEGPSENAVHHAQDQLGLASLPARRPSYAKMVGEFLDRAAPAPRELRFPHP
jgi:predicted adenylyl cyclase CyaB